jgi:hypothetical protein
MNKFILAFALTALTASCASAAEPGAISYSIKFAQTGKCQQDNCSGITKGSVIFSHTIALTPTEENGLNENTSITVLLDGFPIVARLGDDPQFTPGDTSAKVIVAVPVTPSLADDAILQFKWGNGELKIKVTLHFSGESGGLEEIVKKSRDAKEINTAEIGVIASSGALVFDTALEVPIDRKVAIFESNTAEGNGTFKILRTIKSKILPPV